MGKRISIYLTNEEIKLLEEMEIKNTSRFFKNLLKKEFEKVHKIGTNRKK